VHTHNGRTDERYAEQRVGQSRRAAAGGLSSATTSRTQPVATGTGQAVPAQWPPTTPPTSSIASRQLAFTPAGAPPCDLAVSRAPWRRIEEAPAPGHLRRSAALMVAARLRHRTRLAGACARETRPASSLPRCVAWRGVASGGRQAIPSIRAQQSGGIPQ
jgi:hypothetical protein